MKTVSIIYYSGRGHAEKLAESAFKGSESIQGIKTNLIKINDTDIINGHFKNDEAMKMLDESDAIIFGTPTYMGGVAAQFKAFADSSVGSLIGQKWKDKLAAGFTISGTPSGDKFSTLQYLQTFAMQHAMIWVSLGETPMQPNGVNRLGSWAGVIAQSGNESAEITPGDDDKLTAELLGKELPH